MNIIERYIVFLPQVWLNFNEEILTEWLMGSAYIGFYLIIFLIIPSYLIEKVRFKKEMSKFRNWTYKVWLADLTAPVLILVASVILLIRVLKKPDQKKKKS